MKQIFTTLAILLITSLGAFAQRQFSHLTLISETNEPFIVYINGAQYNRNPKVGIRIEYIADHELNVRVVFPNNRNMTATHPRLPITDLEGYMQDITYSINPNRRGERAFMVYSVIPLSPINIDNRQIEVYDNKGKITGHEYKDLNSRWQNGRTNYRDVRNRNPLDNREPGMIHNQMSDRDFQTALSTIKNTSMDNSKLELATGIVDRNYMTAQQIFTMAELLSFESNKLTIAKAAFHKCVDQQNYHVVMNTFKFNSSKTELNNYIKGSR